MSSPRPASPRTAKVTRSTSESSVDLSLDIDGTGTSTIDTTVPFFDHLLTAFSKHSLVDLTVAASGDTGIDAHHTVEDTGIVLGKAIKEALGDKSGISRYGDAVVPLDEALVQAVVDLSGRPYLVHSGEPSGFSFCSLITSMHSAFRESSSVRKSRSARVSGGAAGDFLIRIFCQDEPRRAGRGILRSFVALRNRRDYSRVAPSGNRTGSSSRT